MARPRNSARDNEALGLAQRQHGQIQFAVAEQRVADCVKQRAGTIARDDLPRVVQPFHAGGCFDAEPQIAAATGQVERKFRLVAAVNAEAGIHGVKRAVEKLRAVGDDKIPSRPANSATAARRCWQNCRGAGKSIPAERRARHLWAARFAPGKTRPFPKQRGQALRISGGV